MIKLGNNESLPNGWHWVKAQDCMDVRDGTHDSPKSISVGIPLVTSKNLIGGSIDFSTCNFISEEDHISISRRSKVDNGDILYAMIGTIGNPVIVNTSQEFAIKNVALFKFLNDDIFNKYIYYFLNSSLTTRQFQKKSRGGTQKFVSLGNIRELEIPLPPLAEQKRIAAILDKADAIRRKRQQAIELADEFLRSVFLDMFGDPVTWSHNRAPSGWEVNTIENISPLKRGYDLPVQARISGKYKVIAANSVVGEHHKGKVAGPGVITGRSGTIGKVIFSKDDFWPLNTTLYVTNFCGNNKRYIEFYLRFMKLERYVQGAGVPTLNRNLFLKELSLTPPRELQDRFESLYDTTKKLCSSLDKDVSSNLFNSLSQKAFRGEL